MSKSKITIQTIIDSSNDRNLESNKLVAHRKNIQDMIFMSNMMSNILTQYEEDLQEACLLSFINDVFEGMGYNTNEHLDQKTCDLFVKTCQQLKGRKS